MDATTSSSLAHQLADRIRNRIQIGSFADGDLFMTEAQLATEYDVSRTVAREAVSRLRALGIVEGRQRKGLVVRRPDPLRLLSQSLPFLASSTADLHELAQLRYALEVGAIELAVRNATNEQIAELGRLTEAFVTAMKNDAPAEVVALDLKFHSLLLQMTGSTLVSGMQQVLIRFFASLPYRELDQLGVGRVVWEHRELYAAIRDRDVERARSMVRLQLLRHLPGIESQRNESTAEAPDTH